MSNIDVGMGLRFELKRRFALFSILLNAVYVKHLCGLLSLLI